MLLDIKIELGCLDLAVGCDVFLIIFLPFFWFCNIFVKRTWGILVKGMGGGLYLLAYVKG